MVIYMVFIVVVSILSLTIQGYFVRNAKKDLGRIADAVERMGDK